MGGQPGSLAGLFRVPFPAGRPFCNGIDFISCFLTLPAVLMGGQGETPKAIQGWGLTTPGPLLSDNINQTTQGPTNGPSGPSPHNRGPARKHKRKTRITMATKIANKAETKATATPRKGKPLPKKPAPKAEPKAEAKASKPTKAELKAEADRLLAFVKPSKGTLRKAPEPAKPAPTNARKAQAAPAKEETETALKGRTGAGRSKSLQARTIAEIVEGAPKMRDWRDGLHGQIVNLQHFVTSGTAFAPDTESKGHIRALLAIPRDNDVGNEGPQAREGDHIAVHAFRDESGKNYLGAPLYLRQFELASVRIPTKQILKASDSRKLGKR